jgi:tight adherence protein B
MRLAVGRRRAHARSLALVAAVAGTALAVLGAPTGALGQGNAPTLREARDSGFPDKVFSLQLPERRALTASRVSMSENAVPVSDLTVEAPGAATGVVLLIDASNSMQGAPIQGAMQAARRFVAQRNPKLPVAVVVFGPDDTVLTDFTTSQAELNAAVASAPPLAEGTHIYDALTRASELAEDAGLERTTVVLLSDGTDVGSDASRADALEALDESNVRVISVGLRSKQYDPAALKSIAQNTGGTYSESASPAALGPIFARISSRLSSEYTLRYTSLLPPETKATVRAVVAGLPAAAATYTTPALNVPALGAVDERLGTFDKGWIDKVILSPFLMVFVIVSVLALLVFAILTAFDVRSRSIRRRMAQYVTVPTEEESSIRRAEVASMLTGHARSRVAGQEWWQAFEKDVELGGFKVSATTLAGWTVIAGIGASLVVAVATQALWGLLVGLAAPFVTRYYVRNRVSAKRRAFGEQLPDNLEVLAGALRAGHSLVGAMNVMVDGADEPSKTEFRRVLSDEQLGIPIDQALMVTSQRMENIDMEQVAIVTRLQREAGGNTAEVLDRVVENVRGRMEIRRLIRVLTAQGRLARWVLTGLPLVLVGFLMVINPDWLDPLTATNVGRAFLVLWALMLIAGSVVIKRIVEIEV